MSVNDLIGFLNDVVKDTPELDKGFLLGAGYDGDRRVAYLKILDPETQRVRYYYDKTLHKPYCFSKKSPAELAYLRKRDDVEDIVVEQKWDPLTDTTIQVSKIITKDPLAVGGHPSEKSIRNIETCYEADIKYYENYLYDLGLIPGTFVKVENGSVKEIQSEFSEDMQNALKEAMKESDDYLRKYIEEFASLLSQPFPEIKRAAIDIEVLTEVENRLPDAEKASQPIISISLAGNDGRKVVYAIRRNDVELGNVPEMPKDVEIKFFDDEKQMLLEFFKEITNYPIIITFNGDSFDMPYLYHRALNLKIPKEAIPIVLGREIASIVHGIHIDLYKTFVNKSIQGYAFGNKYNEHTLNAISEGILQKEKVEVEGSINDLPMMNLAFYNYTDAMLTLELTSYDNDLLMKLLITLSRIARMNIEDTSRLSVSNWIRSMLIYEHRKRNALIPRKEEIEQKGQEASSKAIIKGKKYQGGFVVEPLPGVHFHVVVLDFASLYPSIIKVFNLSYETVKCPHEECRSNILPNTSYWVCTKMRGMTSLLIGALRDIRVNYFKRLSKKAKSKEEKEFYNVISQALKVVLNASYGVMGFENFPFYCLPVAESTTALGRYSIQQTIEKAKSLGVTVIYGDTDSLFLKNPSDDQVKEIIDFAKEKLGIDLEVDKVYRYVAFSQRKKNYIGVYEDGSVEVKGLSGKKSHVPDFIKNVFFDVINILGRVKSPEDFEVAKEEIRKRIRKAYNDIKNRNVPLDELAFKVMLNKPIEKYTDTTPQHVKAAMLLAQKKEVKPGDIIAFVKTTTKDGVKPVEMARKEEVDVDKYIEFMESTFEQLLDALGFSFDEIIGATKLEDFFGF
ncbi:MAG: DNA-directed DNA polymerase I [Nitrososphaeria archaeon]|nr:DNA-directed DNA polymerase I [Conexivisphaerales archaeon]